MAKIIIIAAIGENRELGRNNDLIWHLREDLKFFKSVTMNHKIVMGYNTFKSLPKLLEGREHIVLTHHDLNLENVLVFKEFEALIDYLSNVKDDVFIIGGASIYELFMEYADELLLTKIKANCKDADVYFPKYDETKFKGTVIKENIEDEIAFTHVRLKRLK